MSVKKPSFPLAEERVVERSDDRVSPQRQVERATGTHPADASLGDPLFAFGGKRGLH
jgi:hypothetical protein